MAGNWNGSSRNATVFERNGHTILKADCQDDHGRLVPSELDLDEHIGDDMRSNKFSWYQRGFTHDADPGSVRFNFNEGGAHQPILRARFRANEADINTAEHITNNNGRLEFDLPPVGL
ncbi:hypothetical protein FE257_012802 [Aspergillus nanangensis]|uniref:Cyanovirin-N domain-containing protein n=1 Tax=Aspergillus nanangensis TaxID=2582783 RepID=A0AAD4GQK2_ASPNN|nr:hypothetical protein FE257_012802 [Aspergillus nanangensis]